MKKPVKPQKTFPGYPTKKELAALVKAGAIIMAAGALTACSQQSQKAYPTGGVVIQKGK